MRKNSVRKWLHAVLDFLPLLVIPIFAIYTRNENYNSNIEVQVQENKEVAFNQLVTNYGNRVVDYYVTVKKTEVVGNTQWFPLQQNVDFVVGHKYYLRLRDTQNVNTDDYIILPGNITIYPYIYPYGLIREITNISSTYIGFVFGANTPQNNVFNAYLNFIDLTFMFGEGNEPTQSQMDEWYTENYYTYTTYKKEIVPNVLTTYNDTDVGSQFVYTLYNATDKYFNCTNLFNLEQVWNWVQLNLFGGNAPLMVYVVWQVIVYEFFMDLIFLLYSVFMFVIDFATNCIDRFTGRANRC